MRFTVLATAAAFFALAVVASAAPMNLGPPAQSFFDKPILLAQGRACRACRSDCYYNYRTSCGYSQSCRSAFTQCMRGCWEDLCR